MNNTTRVLIAFATGVGVGCACGILTAPNSGYRTRRKMRRKGERIVQDVQEIVSDLQDKISESKDKLVDLKVDLVKAVKEKVEQFN
jgi:gas vesicle protein